MTPEQLTRQLMSQWGLETQTAARCAAFLLWCHYFRVPITMTSGRRSRASQQALWDHYQRTGCALPPPARCTPAARPGTSDHETGRAFDASFPAGAEPWIDAISRYVGLEWGGAADPVHFRGPR